MWDVILDALIDSSIAAPFLLIIYLLIEWLERNSRARAVSVRLLNGKLAPLVAGGVGLIPQCGFSVMATDLFCQNFLKLGTLIAFFVATSDEALPILLTNPDTLNVTWIVVLVKIVYAVALGYLINLFDKRNLNAVTDNLTLVEDEHGPHDHSHKHDREHDDKSNIVSDSADKHYFDQAQRAEKSSEAQNMCHSDQTSEAQNNICHPERSDEVAQSKDLLAPSKGSDQSDGYESSTNPKAFPFREGGRCREATDEGCEPNTVIHVSDGCCHHDMTKTGGFWNFVKHPLLHTLKIFVYIFVVNAIFGLLLFYFEQPIKTFTANLGFAQSFITALVGLVPNCASSVIVTGMYAGGIIGLPALLAGLVSNSGIALAILFKDRKHLKRNFAILGMMYLAGIVIGIPAYFIAGLF